MSESKTPVPADYMTLLEGLKDAIRASRLRAALAVNAELLQLYWRIGRDILVRQAQEGWGAKVVDRLAADLRAEFPEMQGLSARNLNYMRAFAEAWSGQEILPQAVAQLPWGHNRMLIDKLSAPDERLWYAAAAVENGWSRDVLSLQISTCLHERQGGAITNFATTLPPSQSDLAQQLTKDPYAFDFLTIATDAHERHVETALINRVRDFLLEMGKGFSLIGTQHRLEVGGQDWYVDILFYHRKLRCLVAVDLKMGEFRPEHAGKMNFYLAALDDLEREPDENPSIGLILCRERNRIVVEYALRDMQAPIGVARYTVKVADALPAELLKALPTAEEIEAEIPTAALDEDDTLGNQG